MEVKGRPIYFARETNIGQESVEDMVKEVSRARNVEAAHEDQ